MLNPQLVAVDTNVLMRLADGHEATADSWQLLKRRIRPVQFVALPTVMEELALQGLWQDSAMRPSRERFRAARPWANRR